MFDLMTIINICIALLACACVLLAVAQIKINPQNKRVMIVFICLALGMGGLTALVDIKRTAYEEKLLKQMLESQNEILGLRNKVKELEEQNSGGSSAISDSTDNEENAKEFEEVIMGPIQLHRLDGSKKLLAKPGVWIIFVRNQRLTAAMLTMTEKSALMETALSNVITIAIARQKVIRIISNA